jgi:hypothetical protein
MSQDSQGVDNVNLVLLSLVQQYLISKTYGTQDEDKQTKNTTQYVLGTTLHEQREKITQIRHFVLNIYCLRN